MVKQSNPVGRLLTIIEKVIELKAENNLNPNFSKRQAWEEILELNAPSELEVARTMLEVCDLARKSRHLIQSFAPNPELYLEDFENVELVVLPSELGASFERTCQIINENTLIRLRFACDMLSHYYDEGDIASEELDNISNLANDLYREVRASNIELSVKTFLLEALEALRRSIVHYDIYGAKGVRDAFQSALGGVVANKTELETTDKNILDKFATLLAVADKTTATAVKAKEVIGKSIALLGFDS